MSPEQLTAAKKAEEEISPEEQEHRRRFRFVYKELRTRNIRHSNSQRLSRITKTEEKKQPVAKRNPANMAGKSEERALRITVLLNMMRKMKGLPLKYTMPERRCKCGRVLREAQERFIHNVRKENKAAAQFIETTYIKEMKIEEFLK